METWITLFLCLVFACCFQNGLAEDVDFIKELRLMKEQVERIAKENTKLKHDLEVLSENNANLKVNVEMVVEENANLKHRMLSLESKMNGESMSTSNTDLGVEHDKVINNMILERKLTDAQYMDKKREDQNRTGTLENKINKTFSNGKGRRLLMPTPPTSTDTLVAFYAKVDKALTNLGDNQDIPFQVVETNIGHAFHPGTGVFSCPRNGVYAFFVTILTYPNIRVETEISKEGSGLAFTYSYGDSSHYGTGSTSAIVRLQKGEKVWIRVYNINHVGSGNMIYPSYSSFMGFSVMLE